MKKVFSGFILLVLTIVLVACGNTTSDNVLRVGMEVDYPPFNWAETTANEYNHPVHGQPGTFVAGYDVDMAKKIAKELDMELEIRMIEWNSLIPALQSGQIDLIIAG